MDSHTPAACILTWTIKKLFLDSQSEYGLLAFTKDSGLLVVLGDLDGDESREGAFYFVLEREQLRLIHSTPVKKNCEPLRGAR